MPKDSLVGNKRIGIFGGSFNPPHIGHLIIGSYVLQQCGLDEVWFLVSPLNPLKADNVDLAKNSDRIAMVSLLCDNYPKLRPCDIEFSMTQPSFTCDTLHLLSKRFPLHDFSLIIGGDNWSKFNRWRNYEEIISGYEIIVYPRPEEKIAAIPSNAKKITVLKNAPSLNLSATFIRQQCAGGYDIRPYLTTDVYNYILENNLYK